MKWLQNLFAPRRIVVVLPAEQMNEHALTAACKTPADQAPFYRALLQLIETARENAFEQAAQEIARGGEHTNTHRLVGYVAGASHLRMLRDEILARRAAPMLPDVQK